MDPSLGHRQHPPGDGLLLLHGVHHGWLCTILHSLTPWLFGRKYPEELPDNDICLHVNMLFHHKVIHSHFSYFNYYVDDFRPGASSIDTVISFIAFLVLEVAIGMYFPAISYLRGVVIPESNRANVMNWFR